MGLDLQAGRGLVEDVIPPVEAELLSFPVAHLRTERVSPTPKQELRLPENTRPTHSSFVTLHFHFDGLRNAIFCTAQAFTCREGGVSDTPAGGCDWEGQSLTVFPAVTQKLLLCKRCAAAFLRHVRHLNIKTQTNDDLKQKTTTLSCDDSVWVCMNCCSCLC